MDDPRRAVSKLARWADVLVSLLDDRFRIPGTDFRFGIDPIIGLLFPGVGDAVTGIGSIGLLTLALRRGVPRVILGRMLFNILVDVILGAAPVIGDIFDAAWKSNRRNLALIRQHEDPESKPGAGDYAIVALGLGLAVLSIIVPLVAVFYFGIHYGPEIWDYLGR
jgi:hypothetical protein